MGRVGCVDVRGRYRVTVQSTGCYWSLVTGDRTGGHWWDVLLRTPEEKKDED